MGKVLRNSGKKLQKSHFTHLTADNSEGSFEKT